MKRVSAPLEARADNENLTHRRYRAAIAGFVTYTARLIYNNSRRLRGGNFLLKPSLHRPVVTPSRSFRTVDIWEIYTGTTKMI